MRSLSDLFRNFLQLGYVTDDVDAAAAFLQASMGTGKCVMSYRASLGGGRPPAGPAGAGSAVSPAGPGSPRPAFVVVDGAPADEWVIDVALVNAGPVNLEVIRPVDGAVDLYRDGVRPGAPVTLHHVGFVVDDFDEASAVVAASGRRWKQFGDSGEIRFGYLDMRAELGHFVEVMELGQPAAQWMAQIDAASAVSLAAVRLSGSAPQGQCASGTGAETASDRRGVSQPPARPTRPSLGGPQVRQVLCCSEYRTALLRRHPQNSTQRDIPPRVTLCPADW